MREAGRISAMALAAALAAWSSAGANAAGAPTGDATAVTGEWWTPGHDGVIRVARCGDAVCGTLAGMDYTGNMPRTYAGTPQCGWPLMRDFRPGDDKDGMLRGMITDPDSGKVYHATLRSDGSDAVKLRGYVLVPLLGSTQRWTRFRGRLDAACHIHPD